MTEIRAPYEETVHCRIYISISRHMTSWGTKICCIQNVGLCTRVLEALHAVNKMYPYTLRQRLT